MRGPRSATIALALAAAVLGAGLEDRSAFFAAISVDTIGMTVSDMDRALAFYTGVLPFTKVSETEVSGREYELLTGVFGARARVARLRLGTETLELTEFLAPRGRPFPADVEPNDRLFQHIAIVVRDIEAAYRALRAAPAPPFANRGSGIEHASTAPQRLPDWNPHAGGIKAFYFRDPDRHFLELIEFPPGKGDPKWQAAAGLFAGIDHTAIVVDDTDVSVRFYRDAIGLEIAGESENHGPEQEHLNNVFGARLRITALRTRNGPGIELLEYLAPRTGRPAPPDLRSNDIAHWQTTVAVTGFDALLPLARLHRLALVSPGVVEFGTAPLGFARAALIRDSDGHGLRLVQR